MDSDLETPVAVNRLHFPVTALGPGDRCGIWFQGCSIGCAGCVARDTWAPSPPSLSTVSNVIEWVFSQPADGVTISGGEPFDQPEALFTLLETLAGRVPSFQSGILVYSGYSLRSLQESFPDIVDLVDVLISGPYVSARGCSSPLIGSDNQVITYLNDALVPAFREYIHRSMSAPPFQVEVTNEGVWMIGIPRPGDLDALMADLSQRGVRLEDVSWKA